MKRLSNILGFGLVLLIMAATALVYVGPHFGLRIDNVLSGSMAPELERGTLVIALSVKPETIEKGDIIVFRQILAGERPMVHRVIDIKGSSPRQFVTKGDALARPDPLTVPARNVVGRVVYHIRLLGFIAQFLKTVPGFLLGLVMPGIALLLICLEDIRGELTKKKRDSRQ